jgi:hypothetical protein
LCRDNIPTIILFEWNLETDYIDEEYLSGLLPVLFAADPKEAEAGIKAHQAFALKDIDRLNRMFFIPEGLDLEEAHKVVKKARLGDVDYVFKARNLERIFDAVPLQDTQGKFTLFTYDYIKFITMRITQIISQIEGFGTMVTVNSSAETPAEPIPSGKL